MIINLSDVYGELETVVYSFLKNKHQYKRPVFFGILYHSRDTQKYFNQHGFKTVPHLTVIMLEPAVWFFIAMMTYWICTGGIVYSIIHGVPWFKLERDQYGGVFIAEYFMKG